MSVFRFGTCLSLRLGVATDRICSDAFSMSQCQCHVVVFFEEICHGRKVSANLHISELKKTPVVRCCAANAVFCPASGCVLQILSKASESISSSQSGTRGILGWPGAEKADRQPDQRLRRHCQGGVSHWLQDASDKRAAFRGARLGNGRLPGSSSHAGTWRRGGDANYWEQAPPDADEQEKLEKMDFTKFPKLDKKKMDNLEEVASAAAPAT